MALEFAYDKQPGEQHKWDVSFANELASGETISSVAITATLADGTTDASATVIEGAGSISGALVTVTTKAGTDETDYRIKVVATTSDSNTPETDVLMQVREQ